jgi:hypothetical protein
MSVTRFESARINCNGTREKPLKGFSVSGFAIAQFGNRKQLLGGDDIDQERKSVSH